MRKLLLYFFCIALLLAQPARAQEPPANLTVLADGSLMLPLAHIARLYTLQTNTPLTLAVQTGETTADQIEQGLEAHLLITADQPLIRSLRNSGLTDVFSGRPIVRTQLALVGSSDLLARTDIARHISLAAILYAQPELPVYMTPPTTHEGQRAAQLMEGKDYSEILTKRATPLPSREAVLERLDTEPGFALLLATDALNAPSLKVLSIFSDETVAPVHYEAVLLASESMDQARGFINFLLSEEGQRIFAQFGFQTPIN
jgi:ABC-type molybdate transport system substrate-binding protein